MARPYRVVMVAGFVPPDVDLAWDALIGIERAGEPRDPLIALFIDKAADRFADCAIYADDDEDSETESEECGARFNFTCGNRHVRASIMSTDQDDDARHPTAFALLEGLVAFDLVTGQIHRPGGFAGVTLKIEDRPAVVGPRLAEVLEAIAALTPDGGPSFMVLERAYHDYAQTAGGDGHFAFEWREPAEGGFRHWAAGYPDEAVRGSISVMTNGYHVPVRSNENLAASAVTRLFESYLNAESRPSDILWRDMTGEFERAKAKKP